MKDTHVGHGMLTAQAAGTLRPTLTQAQFFIEAGRNRQATMLLRAFTKQVTALVKSRRLPAESGAALICAANEIIIALR